MNAVLTPRELRTGPPPSPQHATIEAPASIGLFNLRDFELTLRVAEYLANSNFVPYQYRRVIQKVNSDGSTRGTATINEAAVPNCVMAVTIANRLGIEPLTVMLSMVPIEGRPSWSSTFIIGMIETCGRYTGVNWRTENIGRKKVNYTVSEWDDAAGRWVKKQRQQDIEDIRWTAWTTRVSDDQVIEASVTLEIAIKEGWYHKPGSKWPIIEDQMGKYRSASFLGRLTVADRLLGLPSTDELEDISAIVVEPNGQTKVSPIVPRSAGMVEREPDPAAGAPAAEEPSAPPPAEPAGPQGPTLEQAKLRLDGAMNAVALAEAARELEAEMPADKHVALGALVRARRAAMNSAPPALDKPDAPVTFDKPRREAAAAPVAATPVARTRAPRTPMV